VSEQKPEREPEWGWILTCVLHGAIYEFRPVSGSQEIGKDFVHRRRVAVGRDRCLCGSVYASILGQGN